MTAQARVEAEIAAPAEAVWDIFRWENLAAAVRSGLFAGVDYEEQQPIVGATRIVHLPGGGAVRERLLSIAGDGLGLRYQVLNLTDFPLSHYIGSVSVEALGADKCRLTFACEFEPRGITADEWRQAYEAMQQEFIAYVRTKLEVTHQET